MRNYRIESNEMMLKNYIENAKIRNRKVFIHQEFRAISTLNNNDFR